jgi:hypothetical protein
VIIALLLAVAASTASNGFPKEFQGRWGEDAGGCSSGAIHGGLTISQSSVADGEFSGTVKAIKRKPDGSIDVMELWDFAEASEARMVSRYSLSKDGKSLTVQTLEPGSEYLPEPMKLMRCEAQR